MSSWLLFIYIAINQLRFLVQSQSLACEEERYNDIREFFDPPSCTSSYLLDGPNGTVPGITITEGPSTTIVNNSWRIQPITQQGVDLTINLSPLWGLDPSEISSFEIRITGRTSNQTEFNSKGTVLLIVSAGDQYFAEEISLGSVDPRFRECPPSNSPLITRDLDQMINVEFPDIYGRYDRFCDNGYSWTETDEQHRHHVDCDIDDTQPFCYGLDESVWQQFFRWDNFPNENRVHYEWLDYHKFPSEAWVQSEFNSSFTSLGEGWTIYIAGTDPNDEWYIDDINFWYQRVTLEPTASPTPPPTGAPTVHPTTDPTTEPTTIPSYFPTMEPTMRPTEPTMEPTTYPTGIPTAEGQITFPVPIETITVYQDKEVFKDNEDILQWLIIIGVCSVCCFLTGGTLVWIILYRRNKKKLTETNETNIKTTSGYSPTSPTVEMTDKRDSNTKSKTDPYAEAAGNKSNKSSRHVSFNVNDSNDDKPNMPGRQYSQNSQISHQSQAPFLVQHSQSQLAQLREQRIRSISSYQSDNDVIQDMDLQMNLHAIMNVSGMNIDPESLTPVAVSSPQGQPTKFSGYAQVNHDDYNLQKDAIDAAKATNHRQGTGEGAERMKHEKSHPSEDMYGPPLQVKIQDLDLGSDANSQVTNPGNVTNPGSGNTPNMPKSIAVVPSNATKGIYDNPTAGNGNGVTKGITAGTPDSVEHDGFGAALPSKGGDQGHDVVRLESNVTDNGDV